MSRIQKALEAIRNQKGDSAKTKQAAERFVAHYGPNVRLDTGRYLRKSTEDDSGISVALPEKCVRAPVRNRVQLDRDLLEQSGFLPTGEDTKVIEEQFRRAKRPLIEIAFQTGYANGANANVIMVASAMPGAGKSFCSINLARSIARERDIGAVLVDADVLRASISRSFGLADYPGLIDYLADSSLELDDVVLQSDFDDLVIVPSGQQNVEATELLSSRRMQKFVSELSAHFRDRLVICDTPPLLVTNEAHVLARHVGQIVFVIEARCSTQESVLQALGSLDREKPINAILNKSRTAIDAGFYGDDYGYYPFRQDTGDDGEDFS